MRKLLATAGLVVFVTVAFVNSASAGLKGPWSYSGRSNSHCEAPTHVSYYDPRNMGPTIYNQGAANGDSVYYVDTDPTAGFNTDPDLAYMTAQNSAEDCKGTPVLRTSAYVAVTAWSHHVGYPTCPRPDFNDRNPKCDASENGVHWAYYVGKPDRSMGTGTTGAYTVP